MPESPTPVRPILPENELRVVTIKIRQAGLDWIDNEAYRRRISRAVQIREMLAYASGNMPKREPTQI